MPETSSDLSRPVKPLIPLLAAALFTTVLLILATCQYETSDDMTMIRLLSGRNGLDATPDAVFLSLPLGALLYKLYQAAGHIPWYGLFLYACLIAGCSVGLRIIISVNTNPANKISCGIAYLGFYSYLVCQLNFAGVSLFLWLSTIAAIFIASKNNNTSNRTYFIYGCLLAASFLIRPGLLKVLLFFSAPMLASFCIYLPARKLVVLLLPLLIVSSISISCNYIYKAGPQDIAYSKFNKARSDLLDLYTGDSIVNTIETLDLAKWSIPDYILANIGWIHDSTIYNEESFGNFTKMRSNSLTNMFSLKDSLKSFKSYKLHVIAILICTLLTATSLAFTRTAEIYQLYVIMGATLFTVGATVLMSFIRLPPRIALPVFSYIILLAIISSSFSKEKKLARKKIRLMIEICCVFAVIAITYTKMEMDYSNRKLASSIKRFTDQTIKQVVANLPIESVYINTNAQNFSFFCEATHPLTEYNGSLPILDFPNGWLIASPAYNSFLQNQGFIDRKNVVQQMIDNKRVVFHYWQLPNKNFELFATDFLTHLRTRYVTDFPGRTFQIEKIMDNRWTSGNFGWVFFRINAVAP